MEISPNPARRTQEEVLPSAENTPSPELGREDFLKLLIAQLENQDPMNPDMDRKFVSELATFSSLEQLISANQNLQGLAVGQSSLINAQALSLIGKEALVESGDSMRIVNGEPDGLVYAVPRSARSATLTVFGSDGVPVRVFDLETEPNGRINLAWDGTDADGSPLPDGEYRFEVNVVDLEGEPMEIALFRSIPIEGVNFGEAGIELVSGDREIPFESILEIRASQSSS